MGMNNLLKIAFLGLVVSVAAFGAMFYFFEKKSGLPAEITEYEEKSEEEIGSAAPDVPPVTSAVSRKTPVADFMIENQHKNYLLLIDSSYLPEDVQELIEIFKKEHAVIRIMPGSLEDGSYQKNEEEDGSLIYYFYPDVYLLSKTGDVNRDITQGFIEMLKKYGQTPEDLSLVNKYLEKRPYLFDFVKEER
jgi:hypothetical protein